jgi:nucleoside-triphosphatase THEP1
MELFSAAFRDAVTEALDSDHPVVAAVGMQDVPFLNEIRRRPDVERIELTLDNRDAMVDNVLRRLTGSNDRP